MLGIALTAALAVTGMVAAPAQAIIINPPCPIDSDTCGGGGDGGGGGGGGTTPSYVLQGVIQQQGYDSNANGRRVNIRGYSRLADSGNDRVDADFIEVRCNAYDALGGYTTSYDSENNGALVDVHFSSNFVYGIGPYRTITVQCTHHATKNGISYDTISSTQIAIPE
ncbi:hypothetical protein ACWGDX_36275 [Streptomyces sp. NPDC055025]